eukprot:CAMPEP_0174949598 /NCGR_PEP_ID=MMETSP1355-20121228/91842_1 /TAXON_ID=464990 /ORGANISM="Hemiselmis tepida, Strain CCMP443" /LENGTH=107 /DNA_ID=CAMNT_0016197163 /DNA_START=275 /DNA_END=594 /DNA_ORIENTATION=-
MLPKSAVLLLLPRRRQILPRPVDPLVHPHGDVDVSFRGDEEPVQHPLVLAAADAQAPLRVRHMLAHQPPQRLRRRRPRRVPAKEAHRQCPPDLNVRFRCPPHRGDTL